ncbi:hypothetical protein CLAFUW4_00811 [Fulvia fulva]|uniref:Uncharacterized protein n=1 Tax=Passalora fulva TaxID=5499 RepID=A0A9Q8L7A1_PASFU|nr:uncharacterized protein CLAFUR5_00814 [Fulvia fulva]KAK4635368.1 hypothetical protein CLAFUR4_00812 [Fulvia fulva]KAK4638171.1 hypothetical protein CLAFUR0_00813 [Fulvia fulva]UJO12117.1 hypothetical protein CLAFUR5_00814 [Fulvia fulva]WPV09095.1 hypothetical protein CLAFUW4_00811 [Fulvia fulva]WPV24168.1 hypothetical protein CLAFUW7_01005 [Fulvia fulva]
MRFHQTPRPLLQLITTILLAPRHSLAFPNVGFELEELFARDCTPCGYYKQICCAAGETCGTNSAGQAVCNAGQVTAAASGGYWQYITSTYVETDLVTRTTVMSTYIGGAAATGIACNYANNESPCGSICCASGQYCFKDGQCTSAAGGSSSAYYSSYTTPGATAGAPIRPTSSDNTVVTATKTPTTTVAFIAPVPTGANVTLTSGEMNGGGGGLSGGAIAGIVIGVLAGLLLLGLLCFYCCLKGLLDGCLACFGLGKKKRSRRTEVEEYERYSHHDSRHGGRTWYGAARPPARVDRTSRHSDHNKSKGILGVGAGLAALWAILGLKRRHDRRDEKHGGTEYSYSSDYYTSSSSASSDDRRTRTYGGRSQSRR